MSVNMFYFTERAYACPLFTVPFRGDSLAPSFLKAKELDFQILRNTAQMLREWYGQIHTACAIPHAPHLFPQPSAIAHHFLQPRLGLAIDILRLSLVFTHKIDSTQKSQRILYKGVMLGDSDKRDEHGRRIKLMIPVYIKFVVERDYGEVAQELLANHQLAPKVYFCDRVMFGITMVVMEDLGGMTLGDLYVKRQVSTVRRYLKRATTILQSQNLVHGDIRPPNVVYVTRKDGDRVYLIDFDWAGKEGETKYPEDLNPKIRWAQPAADLKCQLIKREHDDYMCEELTSDAYFSKKQKTNDGGARAGPIANARALPPTTTATTANRPLPSAARNQPSAAQTPASRARNQPSAAPRNRASSARAPASGVRTPHSGLQAPTSSAWSHPRGPQSSTSGVWSHASSAQNGPSNAGPSNSGPSNATSSGSARYTYPFLPSISK